MSSINEVKKLESKKQKQDDGYVPPHEYDWRIAPPRTENSSNNSNGPRRIFNIITSPPIRSSNTLISRYTTFAALSILSKTVYAWNTKRKRGRDTKRWNGW
jgi:hypothetical protein